jgi:hypothetical protein
VTRGKVKQDGLWKLGRNNIIVHVKLTKMFGRRQRCTLSENFSFGTQELNDRQKKKYKQ